MGIRTIVLLLIASIVFSSCAMSYRAISPVSAFKIDTVNEQKKGITISCSEMDIISAKNTWVKRKLERDGMVLVPVKVENNSERPFVISSNTIDFINDFTPVALIESGDYIKEIRQKVWPNLLLFPVALIASIKKEEVEMPGGGNGIREVYRLNVLSGAVALWGIVNFTRTILVNSKSKKDILLNDLCLKSVLPNSVRYGVICIKAKAIKNPMVRIKNL